MEDNQKPDWITDYGRTNSLAILLIMIGNILLIGNEVWDWGLFLTPYLFLIFGWGALGMSYYSWRKTTKGGDES